MTNVLNTISGRQHSQLAEPVRDAVDQHPREAPIPRVPRWHGTLPRPVADAVDAVLASCGDVSAHSIGRTGGSPSRLHVLQDRLRSAVNTNSAADVRAIVSMLIATPVIPHDDNSPELNDAVATLADRAELLLTCPTCGHRPAEDLPLEMYAQHLSDLSCTWLDLVDDDIREVQHCHPCAPAGYSGIELSCSVCEDGFLLEAPLARYRLDLPPAARFWLNANDWDTSRCPELTHARCAGADPGRARVSG